MSETTGKTETKVGDVIGTAKIVYGGRVTPPPLQDDREPEEIERERLECEVISAAKSWSPKRGVHAMHHTARMCPTCAAERRFHAAVEALESFEAKHK